MKTISKMRNISKGIILKYDLFTKVGNLSKMKMFIKEVFH